MPSATYNLIKQAIQARKSITATYGGHRRELTPHVLGHTDRGEEQAFFFQFGGSSSTTLPPGGQWRCLALRKLSNVAIRDDSAWHEGTRKGLRKHSCVDAIDVSVRQAP